MRDWNPVSNRRECRGRGVCSLPMRDWNPLGAVACRGRAVFVAYLWGIETATRRGSKEGGMSFVAYLWGIETKWGYSAVWRAAGL